MAIPTEVVEEFDPKIRERGHEYFIAGDVRILETGDGFLRARVHGSQFYNVTIDFSDGWLDYDCDCPYAESWGGPCKHVWAAHAEGGVGGNVSVRVRNGEQTMSRKRIVAEKFRCRRRRERAREKEGAAHRPGMEEDAGPAAQAGARSPRSAEEPPAVFPEDRRIVYFVDVHRTLEGGAWAGGRSHAPEAPARWDMGSAQVLVDRSARWLNAPEETDRMIAQLLIGADAKRLVSGIRARSGSTSPEIDTTRSFGACAIRGRCGLRFVPKQKDFKPLKWDEAGPWEFELDLERSSGEKFVILTGSLRRGDERMALDKPTLLLAEGLVITETHRRQVRASRRLADRSGDSRRASDSRADRTTRRPARRALEDAESATTADSRGIWRRGSLAHADQARAAVSPARSRIPTTDQLAAKVTFDYDGHKFEAEERVDAKLDSDRRRLIRRNREIESRAMREAERAGISEAMELRGKSPAVDACRVAASARR